MGSSTLKSVGGAIIGLAVAAGVAGMAYVFVPGVSNWVNNGGSIQSGATSQAATSVESADHSLGVAFPGGTVFKKAAVGSALSFVGTLTPANANYKSIVWAVSDSAKVKLSAASSLSGDSVSATVLSVYSSYVTLTAAWAGDSSVSASVKLWCGNAVASAMVYSASYGIGTTSLAWTSIGGADLSGSSIDMTNAPKCVNYGSYAVQHSDGLKYGAFGLNVYNPSTKLNYLTGNYMEFVQNLVDGSGFYGTWCKNQVDALAVDILLMGEDSQRMPTLADKAGISSAGWTNVGTGLAAKVLPCGYVDLRMTYRAGTDVEYDLSCLVDGGPIVRMTSQDYVAASSVAAAGSDTF